jgi:hypothetical protein
VSAARPRVGSLVVMAILAVTAMVAANPAAQAAEAGHSTGLPYSDSSAVGYIGLCNKSGHQITHGSTTTKPLAARAVSSQSAQAPYNEPGRTATLLAYQPREGLPAGDWSGDELTASSRYTNPAHPMTAATSGDDSLQDFIAEFHPMWDGLLQIRMYLGAPDHPIYSLTYPALNLQVTGKTWHQIGGGAVDCRSGQSESIESILLPKATPSARPSHHPKAHSTSASPGPTASATPLVGGSSAGPGSGTNLTPSPVAKSASASSGTRTALIVGIVIAAAMILGAALYFVARRRRLAP